MRVASVIQRALQQQGYEVHIATSSRHFAENFDFKDVHWHELPGMKMDEAGFHRLTPNGLSIKDDTAYSAKRAAALKAIAEEVKPDAVVTENWPLGRSEFDPELIGMMEHIKKTTPKTQCFSLSREILFGGVGRDSASQASSQSLVRNYFNGGVIVLGSRDAPGLHMSVPEAEQFEDKLFYAGFLAADIPPRNPRIAPQDREVVVSVGGGATQHGMMLAEMAIRAHHQTKNASQAMRVFLPPTYQTTLLADGTNWKDHLLRIAAQQQALHPELGPIHIQNNSPDFLQHLADASMSISQGGSNTTFEVASAAGVDALIAPFKQGYQDIGQEIRSQIFRDLGLVGVADIQVIDPTNSGKVKTFAAQVDATIGTKSKAEEALGQQLGLK